MAGKAKKAVTVNVSSPGTMQGALKRIGGSQSDTFNTVVAGQAVNSLWTAHADEKGRDELFDAAISGIMGIQPRDEVEGMLAAQLLATHSAAMESFRRAMLEQQSFEGRRENLNQANRLVRSYATLMEALNRYRGKGHQRVTVEHVHVHEGGQAIVGAVRQGCGAPRQTEKERAHASRAIAHEPGTPLRSPDPDRLAVPIPSGTGTASV
jgi:hypothetical protein